MPNSRRLPTEVPNGAFEPYGAVWDKLICNFEIYPRDYEDVSRINITGDPCEP